ncbi:type II toxin-antitoxin system VapC family toxin [Candidatus Woesearchaeota archaeon]|nr:type II toxin-antitoxin system VapC family toxin [Candidatus Woesearchaeota archaeon]
MKPNIIRLQRNTRFYGKRKVGLDTNILIKLYEQPHFFDYEEARIFNQEDTIFVDKIGFSELIKYLKKSGLNEETAKEKANNWLKKHNITKIYEFIPQEELERFEQESNKKLKELNLFAEDFQCHRPDSIILLTFRKYRINKVISTDRAFRKCAEFLDMDAESMLSLDSALKRKMRDIFGRKNRR